MTTYCFEAAEIGTEKRLEIEASDPRVCEILDQLKRDLGAAERAPTPFHPGRVHEPDGDNSMGVKLAYLETGERLDSPLGTGERLGYRIPVAGGRRRV
jgi:hypothetical protein